MKIDPIYVLAPLPKPPSMPTRRAMLIAACSFVGGTAFGGACGYSMGAASSTTAGSGSGSTAAEADLVPSGDAELDEWRRLAVKAPLDELFKLAPQFLAARISDYQKDEIMWQGVARMAHEIVSNPGRAVTEADVFGVISHVQGQARPAEPALRELLPQLKARREAIRSRR